MEVWHVYVDDRHYSDYYFPEEENLEVLLFEVEDDVETKERRVSSSYIQPDNYEIRLWTTHRNLSGPERLDNKGW